MKTDDLMTVLSQVPPPRPPMRLWALALLLCAGAAALIAATLGVRPDFGAAMQTYGFWGKTLFLGGGLVMAVYGLCLASRPVRFKDWPMLLIGMSWGALLKVMAAELEYAPLDGIVESWFSATGWACFGFVLAYGAAAMILLARLMRHYAPADPRHAAAYIGFAAALAAATGYSIHCRMDNAAYIVFAYGAPILLLVLVARLALPKFLKW